MPMSDQGIDLLSQREGGYILVPYQDSKGIWTDGLGNTHGVIPHGPAISLEKAKADFQRNLAWVEAAIAESVKVPLQQHEHDALGSFTFNVGADGEEHSTMVREINAGDMADVPAQFDRWHIPAEIATRRNGEREQWKGTGFSARCDNEGNPIA